MHEDTGAVTQVGDLRTIRREEWLEGGFLILCQLCLLEITCVREERIILTCELCHIDVPPAITLSCIDDLTTIGAYIDITLLLGSIRDTLRRSIVCRCDIDIPMDNEGDLLITWCNSKGREITAQCLANKGWLFVITYELDFNSLGTPPRRLRIDLPIIAIA